MSSTASLSNQQLPPACGARQLCKLKRFLTTLQQFGNDISPEIGERVRSLVLGLVVSAACDHSDGSFEMPGMHSDPFCVTVYFNGCIPEGSFVIYVIQ